MSVPELLRYGSLGGETSLAYCYWKSAIVNSPLWLAWKAIRTL